jgi:hypothetical protein
MIFIIFSPNNLAKNIGVFAQIIARFLQKCDHNIGL